MYQKLEIKTTNGLVPITRVADSSEDGADLDRWISGILHINGIGKHEFESGAISYYEDEAMTILKGSRSFSFIKQNPYTQEALIPDWDS